MWVEAAPVTQLYFNLGTCIVTGARRGQCLYFNIGVFLTFRYSCVCFNKRFSFCQALVPSPVLLDPKPIPNQSKIKIQVQLGLG